MKAKNDNFILNLIGCLLLLIAVCAAPAMAQDEGDDDGYLTLDDVPELIEGFNCKSGRRQYQKLYERKVPRIVRHQDKVISNLEKGISRLDLRGERYLECEGGADDPSYCYKAEKVLSRLERHKEVKTRKAETKLARLYTRVTTLVLDLIDLAEIINAGEYCNGDGRRS